MTFLVICLAVINQNCFDIVFYASFTIKLILVESKALRFNRVPQNFCGGYRVPIARKKLRTTEAKS